MTSNEAAHEGTGEETLQTPRRPWVVMAVSECKWGQDDGVGRYCLTHEAWMRAVIGTQCPVGELRAQVQRVRELHAPCLDPEVHNGDRCCLVCSDHGRRGEYTLWPCLTIRALDGDA